MPLQLVQLVQPDPSAEGHHIVAPNVVMVSLCGYRERGDEQPMHVERRRAVGAVVHNELPTEVNSNLSIATEAPVRVAAAEGPGTVGVPQEHANRPLVVHSSSWQVRMIGVGRDAREVEVQWAVLPGQQIRQIRATRGRSRYGRGSPSN